MLNLIYLAAGSGSRFGGNKLLYRLNGKPMFSYGLSLLYRCAGNPEIRDRFDGVQIYMVISENFPAEILEKIKTEPEITTVLNRESGKGISTSVRAGLRSAGKTGSGDHYLFLVADQPYLKDSTVCEFLIRFAEQEKGIGCAGQQDFPGSPVLLGNPVIFSEKYLPALMGLKGDTGGKKIVRENREDCFLYQVSDRRELEDIDRRAEQKVYEK